MHNESSGCEWKNENFLSLPLCVCMCVVSVLLVLRQPPAPIHDPQFLKNYSFAHAEFSLELDIFGFSCFICIAVTNTFVLSSKETCQINTQTIIHIITKIATAAAAEATVAGHRVYMTYINSISKSAY